MRRLVVRPAWVLAAVVPLALACGGVSVDVGDHMQPVCELSKGPVPHGDLVQVGIPAAEVKESIHLALGPEQVHIGYSTAKLGDPVDKLLQTQFDEAKALADAGMGVDPPHTYLLLEVQPTVDIMHVRSALLQAHSVGFTDVGFLVNTKTAIEMPAYPNPEYAAEVGLDLAKVSPEMRQNIAAAHLEGLLTLCPPGQQVFEAVAHAPPDLKCELMAAGMSEALPMCVATDGDKVLTLSQMLTEPQGDFRTAVIDVKLDKTADPIVAIQGKTWGDVAPDLVKYQGKGFWLL